MSRKSRERDRSAVAAGLRACPGHRRSVAARVNVRFANGRARLVRLRSTSRRAVTYPALARSRLPVAAGLRACPASCRGTPRVVRFLSDLRTSIFEFRIQPALRPAATHTSDPLAHARRHVSRAQRRLTGTVRPTSDLATSVARSGLSEASYKPGNNAAIRASISNR